MCNLDGLWTLGDIGRRRETAGDGGSMCLERLRTGRRHERKSTEVVAVYYTPSTTNLGRLGERADRLGHPRGLHEGRLDAAVGEQGGVLGRGGATLLGPVLHNNLT